MARTMPEPKYESRTPEQLRRLLSARKFPHKDLTCHVQLVEAARKSDLTPLPARDELEDLEDKRKMLPRQLQEPGMQVGSTAVDVHVELDRIKNRARILEMRLSRLAAIRKTKDVTWPALFGRDFRHEPIRKSFTDLPREIRDICYGYAFDDLRMITLMCYSPNWNALVPQHCAKSASDSVTNALLRLGTLSVLIHKEARAIFYSMTNFEIETPLSGSTSGKENPDDWHGCTPRYMPIVERCLRGIGDSGRFGLKVLDMPAIRCCPYCNSAPDDISKTGMAAFDHVSSMLLDYMSLTKLHLTISEHYLLRNDTVSLEDFFFHGKALDSSSLQSFQKLLQSLPKLKDATIAMPYIEPDSDYEINFDAWEDMAPFLRYAFTDDRRYKLWLAIKPILEGTKLQTASARVRVALDLGFWDRGEEEEVEDWHPDHENFVAEVTKFIPGDYERWLKEQGLLVEN